MHLGGPARPRPERRTIQNFINQVDIHSPADLPPSSQIPLVSRMTPAGTTQLLISFNSTAINPTATGVEFQKTWCLRAVAFPSMQVLVQARSWLRGNQRSVSKLDPVLKQVVQDSSVEQFQLWRREQKKRTVTDRQWADLLRRAWAHVVCQTHRYQLPWIFLQGDPFTDLERLKAWDTLWSVSPSVVHTASPTCQCAYK